MLIVIVAVIAVIILAKSGVPAIIISSMVPLIFSVLGGLGATAALSFIATPFVGAPVGIMVAVFIFSKLIETR